MVSGCGFVKPSWVPEDLEHAHAAGAHRDHLAVEPVDPLRAEAKVHNWDRARALWKDPGDKMFLCLRIVRALRRFGQVGAAIQP